MAARQCGNEGFFRFHEFLLAMMAVHHPYLIAVGQVPQIVILVAVIATAQVHGMLRHEIFPGECIS